MSVPRIRQTGQPPGRKATDQSELSHAAEALIVRTYLIRRLALLVPVLFGLSLLTFTVSHLVPGDPAILAAGQGATREQIELIRREFALDRPIPEQYLLYLSGLLRGDWGRSVLSRRPVAEDLRIYFPATLELVLVAMALAVALGLPLGVVAAVHRDGWLDHLSRLIALLGVSLPRFFLALLLQLGLSLALNLLPIGGRFDTTLPPPPEVTRFLLVDSLLAGDRHAFAISLEHMILPALALSLSPLAVITRIVRGSTIEVLEREYVLTARAMGLGEVTVLTHYVLKNALISTVTMMGLSFGFLLSGTVLVEAVFDWPGIGLYAVKSATTLDFSPIMGVTLLVGLLFTLTNLLVDLLYGVLDPRIRYG